MSVLDWTGKDKVVNPHHDMPFCVLERVYSFGRRRYRGRRTASAIGSVHGNNLKALLRCRYHRCTLQNR